MVFIDYLTLMLVNTAAGFLTVAAFLVWGLGAPDIRGWAAPLATVGLIALLTGLHLIFVWPLPGPYNILFGELTVLMAAALLGLALSAGLGWSLAPMSLYVALAGLTAIWLGARVIGQGLTAAPTLSGIGFILSGGGAVLVAIVLYLRDQRPLAMVAAVALTLGALIWLLVAFGAYRMHIQKEGGFGKWMPRVAETTETPKK